MALLLFIVAGKGEVNAWTTTIATHTHHLQAVVGRDTTVFTTGSARCVTRDKIISAVT